MSDLVNYVIYDDNGRPLKEWFAIASYLDQMGDEMDSRYAKTDGRKVVYRSLNPITLLRNANLFTYIVLVLLLVVLAAIVLITRAIVRRVNRKKKTA